MIRFALADLERAHAAWSCSCGPAALAAICGLTLDEVRAHFPTFRGWTNPTMMGSALDSARRAAAIASWRVEPSRSWPRYGLARIQWEGPWTAPGANPRWAYRHTHWVGVSRLQLAAGGGDPDAVFVWDCNAMELGEGWSPLAWWSTQIAPRLTADIPRASGGWHVTHAIEVARP
jgi:hypothetical protein